MSLPRVAIPLWLVPRRLRLEWLGVNVGAMALAAGGWLALEALVSATLATRWLLVAGVVLAYEVGFLAVHLHRNRAGDGPVRPTLGPANALTMARGGLFAAVAGFVLVPAGATATPAWLVWLPGVLYGAGAALDFADGAVARRGGRRTELGRRLDLAFDTLGFLVAPLVGVAWGRLPAFYLALSAARYLFRGGLWVHGRRGGAVRALPPSRVRRPLAALQMAFIAGALLPVAPVGLVHPLAAVVLAPSLAVFGRDFLVATGRLER